MRAPKKLTFSREGHKAIVKNPTPYYITLTAIKADGQPTKESVMVPPSGSEDINLPSARAASLSYQTINDYGGLTEEIIWKF
ncbi:fimbrial biogenesis chaperone [Dryocola sp. BD586]|uniref:fimbrial biogenesis chaperone n=1 Tax=Dryocola sp. BD586 TaxID=3133271 RepID=UPI003F4F6F31